jgi:hypothetical protein
MKCKVTLGKAPSLAMPVDSGGAWKTVYGVGMPFQVSPTQAAVIVNRRIYNVAAIDFEDGGDLLVFDSLERLDPAAAVPLSRTETAVDPATGQRVAMVSYQSAGGFVPLGAKLEDGSPHPAAGTGFALSTHIAYPQDPATGRVLRPSAENASHQRILQLRYDGHAVRVTGSRQFAGEDFLPGHALLNRGISVAIPDGADLLNGVVAGPMVPAGGPDGVCIPTEHPHGHPRFGRNLGSALCRWQHRDGVWGPSAIVPVSGPDLSMEPSLVRDADGSLLMAVRGKGLKDPPGAVHDGLENTFCHFRVSRSVDGGRTWAPVLHVPLARAATPVVLNRTAGGHPFLAANPYTRDRRRETLCLWPLTPDRRGVEPPVCALDALARFGAPQPMVAGGVESGNQWMLDHPVATVCRLGDGRWHCLLCLRVSDRGVNTAGAAPTEWNGAWIGEVAVEGERELPVWRF